MSIRKTIHLLLMTLLALPAMAFTATAALDTAQTEEVKVHTILEDGTPYYDACYELFGFSNRGCDENGDGTITFQDVPVGNYVLMQTEEIPYAMVAPVPSQGIEVEIVADQPNEITVMLMEATDSTDLNLITRDPENGESLTGACYELVGYSNIGCDEDGDGAVAFSDIPFGTYTVRQTTAPEGYEPMGDYEIGLQQVMQPGYGPANITLIQADEQGDDTHSQLSVVMLTSGPAERAMSAENCVMIEDLTAEGCDNIPTDGQVDFVGVDVSDPNLFVPTVTQAECPLIPSTPEKPLAVVQYGSHTWVVVTFVDSEPHKDCD